LFLAPSNKSRHHIRIYVFVALYRADN
jgi:hypothetical protein